MTGFQFEFRARNAELGKLYAAGKTLQQIGALHGLTRERVRQIVARQGLGREDGGNHRRSEIRSQGRKNLKEMWAQEKHGCTYAEYRSLIAIRPRPLKAFQQQRSNARIRGIGWEFKLWDWWQVWQQSGKWNQRGRGHGYVMAREGDVGPYSKVNVTIITSVDNIKHGYDYRRAKGGLARGITPRQTEAIELHDQGRSLGQIAEALKIGFNTAKSHVYWARKSREGIFQADVCAQLAKLRAAGLGRKIPIGPNGERLCQCGEVRRPGKNDCRDCHNQDIARYRLRRTERQAA